MGGEIAWNTLGADSYLVTLSLYKDCNGQDLTLVSINGVDCKGKAISFINKTKEIFYKDITPVCKKSCTRCSMPTTCKFPYGVQKHVYQRKIDLATYLKSCCEFTFSWKDCCRYDGITTGAGGGNIYIQATLNACAKPKDNSPVFRTDPINIFCYNQCVSMNFSASDKDIDSNGYRDSLVYSLYKPNELDGKSYAPWSKPYTYDKPLKFDSFPNKNAIWSPPACSGFHIDSLNGQLYFKPTKVETTVFGLMVTEYGKDSTGKVYKKGEIRRDIVIIIIKCPNNHISTLTGINGTSNTDINFCAGRMNCFTINSDDPDINDTISTIARLGILDTLGATFKVEVKKQHPRSTFCWKPDTNAIRNYPYLLVVAASDDACPVTGRTDKVFNIYVKPSEDDTFSVTQGPNCGDYTFSAFPKKGTKPIKAIWQGDDSLYSTSATFTHHYKKPGTYKYALITDFINGCGRSDSGVIIVPSGLLTATLTHDTTVCLGTSLSLDVKGSSGHPPYTYHWSTGDTNATIKPLISKDSIFVAKVTDSLCAISDTIRVKTFASPAAPSLIRIGKDSLESSITSSTYSWYRDSIKTINSSKVIYAAKPGKYQVQYMDSNGCLSPLSAPYTLTGIEGINNKSSINIYPNPTTGLIHIEAPEIKERELIIINTIGEVIIHTTINNHADLDLHNYPKGIYLLKIQDKNECIINRVIRW
jgi:hypothetical protein